MASKNVYTHISLDDLCRRLIEAAKQLSTSQKPTFITGVHTFKKEWKQRDPDIEKLMRSTDTIKRHLKDRNATHQKLKEEVNNFEKYAKDKNERKDQKRESAPTSFEAVGTGVGGASHANAPPATKAGKATPAHAVDDPKMKPPYNSETLDKLNAFLCKRCEYHKVADVTNDKKPVDEQLDARMKGLVKHLEERIRAEKETSSSLYGKHDAQLQAIVIEMQKLGEQQGLKMEHKRNGNQDADTSITHINNMLQHLLRQNPGTNKPDKKVDKGKNVKMVEVEVKMMEDLREAIQNLQKDMTDWESVTEPVLNKKGKPNAEPEPEGIVGDVLRMKKELNKRKLQCKTEAERMAKLKKEIQHVEGDMGVWKRNVVEPPPNPKGTYKAKLEVDTEPEADCVPGRATRKDNNNSNAEKETSTNLYGKHDAQLQAIVIEMQKLGAKQGLKMEHKHRPNGNQDADTSITQINNMLEQLSRMAGDRLRDNNPEIADLSDDKRPTKLAESFSTLYDDVWMDAFDDLTKNKEYELVVISKLLDILKEAYEFCKHVSGRQLEMLTDFAVNPASCVHSNGSSDKGPKKQKADTKIPSKISTAIGDLRKGGSTISFSNILEVSKSKAALSPVEPRTLRVYTERCLELCWYMTLQAPPVVIDFTMKRGDRFNTGKYRSYTKSGENVDFVVWPVLLLHEGGAVLGKGVAQGK